MAVLLPLIQEEAVSGIVGLFVSGGMGLRAFAAAYLIRIRSRIGQLSSFAIRGTRPRYLWIGAALGVAPYLLGVVVAITYWALTGDGENVQTSYQAAAGGALSLVVTLVAGAVITPIGEEFFFRGVIVNTSLSRYQSHWTIRSLWR